MKYQYAIIPGSSARAIGVADKRIKVSGGCYVVSESDIKNFDRSDRPFEAKVLALSGRVVTPIEAQSEINKTKK